LAISDIEQVGKADILTINRFEATANQDSVNYTESERVYNNAMYDLKALINCDPSLKITLEAPKPLTDPYLEIDNPESIFLQAIQVQPRIQINEQYLSAFKSNSRVYKSLLFPTVSVGYSISSLYSNLIQDKSFGKWFDGYGDVLNQNFNQIIAFTLNIPVFNNGHNKSLYRQNMTEFEKQKIRNEDFKIQLKQHIYQSFDDWVNGYKKYNQLVKLCNRYELIHNNLIEKFNIGTISSQELLISQNDLLKTKQEVLSSKLDLSIKKMILDFYRNGKTQ
jgi:outer membrane protein